MFLKARRKTLIGLALLLAGCGGDAAQVAQLPPAPPLPTTLPTTPDPAPRAQAARPVPDAGGLPPGWYVPTPPPSEEAAAAPEQATGGAVPLAAAESRADPAAARPAPRTTPELRTRALLQDFPWISSFWAALGPAERARAERAFARQGQREGLEASWDRMGLWDRVVLLFGRGST